MTAFSPSIQKYSKKLARLLLQPAEKKYIYTFGNKRASGTSDNLHIQRYIEGLIAMHKEDLGDYGKGAKRRQNASRKKQSRGTER